MVWNPHPLRHIKLDRKKLKNTCLREQSSSCEGKVDLHDLTDVFQLWKQLGGSDSTLCQLNSLTKVSSVKSLLGEHRMKSCYNPVVSHLWNCSTSWQLLMFDLTNNIFNNTIHLTLFNIAKICSRKKNVQKMHAAEMFTFHHMHLRALCIIKPYYKGGKR